MPAFKWNSKHDAYVKVCSTCKVEVIGTKDDEESLELFKKTFSENVRYGSGHDQLQSRCWVCNNYKRRDLGITLERLRDMHQKQEGCCAICSVPISLDRGAANPANVDHDEKTGNVRELLCGNCNRGIGLFFHQPEFLRNAAAYCEKHSNDG